MRKSIGRNETTHTHESSNLRRSTRVRIQRSTPFQEYLEMVVEKKVRKTKIDISIENNILEPHTPRNRSKSTENVAPNKVAAIKPPLAQSNVSLSDAPVASNMSSVHKAAFDRPTDGISTNRIASRLSMYSVTAGQTISWHSPVPFDLIISKGTFKCNLYHGHLAVGDYVVVTPGTKITLDYVGSKVGRIICSSH